MSAAGLVATTPTRSAGGRTRSDWTASSSTIDLAAYTTAQEALTGVAVIPVAVVGPLLIELATYELQEPEGDLVETDRTTEDGLRAPGAHGRRALGVAAARREGRGRSGGFRTYVVADRITRASCFVCANTEEAVTLARWIEDNVPAMRDFLTAADFSGAVHGARASAR